MQKNLIIYGISAIVAVTIILIFRRILKQGIERTKLKKAVKEAEAIAKIKHGKNLVRMMDDTTLLSMAKQLDDAIGVLTDDEESIYSVFRKLAATGSTLDLLQLQMLYNDETGDSLNADLNDSLNIGELTTVRAILSKYPTEYLP